MESMFRYWGKANPAMAEPEDWHPLPYHSLDVAAVGCAYLRRHHSLRSHFARSMGADESLVVDWIAFWLVLHDLGKFASSFQGLRPDLLERLQGRGNARPYAVRHDTLGDLVLRGSLLVTQDALKLGSQAPRWRAPLAPWIAAVTGHHGQPPAVMPISLDQHFAADDLRAASDLVSGARELLLPDDTLDRVLGLGPRTLGEAGTRLSWWLAGVAVLADWIGSNTGHFPYCAESMSLQQYWRTAQQRADRALASSGVLPVAAAAPAGVAGLFGWNGTGSTARALTPLQRWSESVEVGPDPGLFLLEDVTGAGKTEAALALAQRLLAGGLADGVFVGLPTMATTNAMYDRIAKMAVRLFDEGAQASLTLAHGQRGLVGRFRDSIETQATVEADRRQTDESASARCAAWLADSNKKALLAQVGVGTVDQALLAILHARHQSLRLLGLFRKVLVVDEVHACDAYMQRLLEALLEFHAAAGGSAILLSATLPMAMKRSLAAAYARGRGFASPALTSEAYPLATRVQGGQSTETPLETRDEVRRRVAVEYLDSRDAIERRIREALAAGRCVCWIRNTVADAIAAWQRFRGELPGASVHLFHARFTMADRLAIEEEVLRRFGPDSGPSDRSGRLVVATQVIEQSLDVDFDLLISDLAPIDRLIQRAGRLRRHVRDAHGRRIEGADARGGARMIVFGPAWTSTPARDWFASAFRGASFVYPHAGQLWHSARVLQSGGWSMPEDGRSMIESVFGPDAWESLPQALRPSAEREEGVAWAAINQAAANHLKLDAGYQRGDVSDWWSDEDAPANPALDDWSGAAAATRLSERSVTLRLARRRDGRLVPWNEQAEHPWEASSLKLPSRMLGDIVHGSADSAAVLALGDVLPDQGRWSVVAVLSDHGHSPRFLSKDARGMSRTWQYDRVAGLRTAEAEAVSGSEMPGM